MKDFLKIVDAECFRRGRQLRGALNRVLQAACFNTVEMPPDITPKQMPTKIYHKYISCQGTELVYPVHEAARRRMRLSNSPQGPKPAC